MSLRKTTESHAGVFANSQVASRSLQRKCECGQHTGGTSECSACSKKRSATLNSSAVSCGARRQAEGANEAFGKNWSNLPSHGFGQNVKVQSAPTNSFEDCPADWKTKANEALARGRPWVANVINGLSNLPDPIPPPVARLLNRHFHTTFSGDIRKIVGHFNTIYR